MDQEDYYEPTDYTQAHGRRAYYLVGYFLLVAILVYPATKLHIGMAGIISAMAGAGIVLGLIWWCIRGMKRRVASLGMSKGEWARFLWGYQSEIVEAEGQATDEVSEPTPTLRLSEHTSRSLAAIPTVSRSDDTLPDRIIENEGLYLSDTYQPGVNSVLGATLLYCGIRRAGKSNGMAATIEELARYLVPMLICDTDDEYGSLVDRRYLPRGVMAGSLSLQITAGEQLPHYIPIDLNGAFEFGQSIPEGLLQVVLNLRSFESDDEAALIICEIIAGMHAWEAGRPNSTRLPCMLFLDEANKWLPQQMGESSLSKDVQHELQKAIFGTMVRRGGKQGLGLAVSTQRISELDKRALQSIFKFLFMQTEQVDIERYMALGLDKDDILTLAQGECFIFSPQAIGFRAMFRKRTSPHLAHTPGLNQLLAHRQRMQPLETFTNRRYVTGLMVPQANCDAEQVMETSNVKAMLAVQEAPRRGPRLSPDLQRALDAYNDGYTSVRDLMAALKVTKHQAHMLQRELKSRHLVTTEQTPDACPSVRPSDPLLSGRTADRQENRTGGQTNGQREA